MQQAGGDENGQEQASTDAFPSGHDRRRRLISALTVLAFLAIAAVALYATSLIVVALSTHLCSFYNAASNALWQSPLPICCSQVP